MTKLTALHSRTNVPGIATAIVSAEGNITSESVGVTRKDRPEAVSDSTVFEAASLSKPVFAYLVIKLAQQGKINLDTPLHTYGDFGPPEMRQDANYMKLTARMLLSHQAGLPNEFNPPDVPFEYVSSVGPELFNYSGEAYRFLNDIVEKVAEKPLETLAQEEFDRIGMTHTSFMPPTHCSLVRLSDEAETPTSDGIKKLLEKESDKHCQSTIIYHQNKLYIAERDSEGNIAIKEKNNDEEHLSFLAIRERFSKIPPFLWDKAIPIEARELPDATTFLGHSPNTTNFAVGHYTDSSVNTNQRFYGPHPAGSLYTTASDYARFLKACMTDPNVAREMFTPSPMDTSLKDRDKKALEKSVSEDVLEKISWGTGIGIQTNADGQRIAFHWGDNGTGRNFAAINLTTQQAIVCLTNSENGPTVFKGVAQPVVGNIKAISQWLSQRESLPMETLKERLIEQKSQHVHQEIRESKESVESIKPPGH